MADNHAKKRTMIKDRVGCVRASSYHLPPDGFVYGKPKHPDPENAGQVISNWVTAKNSATEKEAERSYIDYNIVGIRHGAVTAKSANQFIETHKNIRKKETFNNNNEGKKFEGPFGIKSCIVVEPVGDVLRGGFTNYANEDGDYPDMTGLVKKGALPLPRPTKSATLLAETRRAQTELDAQPQKALFKMKMFQNVESKTKSRQASRPSLTSMDGPAETRPESTSEF